MWKSIVVYINILTDIIITHCLSEDSFKVCGPGWVKSTWPKMRMDKGLGLV